MKVENMHEILNPKTLEKIFPKNRADRFFEALLGDASEGAYDIQLSFKKSNKTKLQLELHLKRRPHKCLACNLTYGLPSVFQRHPVINIEGIAKDVEKMLNNQAQCMRWELGNTREISSDLHIIPLTIYLNPK